MTGPLRLPPGPPDHAVTQLLKYSFVPLAFLEDCAARFGDVFTLRLAGLGTLVVLSRPDHIREIFRGDPTRLHAGEGNAILATVVGETSVLVLDDQPHVRQRRALLPPLKGERMRTFFDAMQTEALAVAAAWADAGIVRADTAMQAVTLRVILRAALGLEPGPALERLQHGMARLLAHVRHPLALVLWRLFPPERYRDSRIVPFYRMRRRFDALLKREIDAQRALAPEHRTPSLLADLLATTHEDGSAMSAQELRDAVVTVLAAGHDTTALALAWALEQILAHPEVVTRIDTELREVCGDALPRIEHLASLVYLDAAIQESLRRRTVIPFVVRLLKDAFEVGGMHYPRDVILCPAIHLLHRRADLYPEPERFRPERFLERRYAAHEWIPFGGGNRACLGQAFALYEMKVVLATLFTKLRMERPPGAVSKPARRGISVGPHDGLRLRARVR